MPKGQFLNDVVFYFIFRLFFVLFLFPSILNSQQTRYIFIIWKIKLFICFRFSCFFFFWFFLGRQQDWRAGISSRSLGPIWINLSGVCNGYHGDDYGGSSSGWGDWQVRAPATVYFLFISSYTCTHKCSSTISMPALFYLTKLQQASIVVEI